MRLVQNHGRTDEFQDVDKTVLDPIAAFVFLQIRTSFCKVAVRSRVVLLGKERGVPAAVPEYFEKILAPLPIGRRQHQQHDAQPAFDVLSGKAVVLLQQFDRAAGKPLKHLPVWVFAGSEGFDRLFIDGLGRHDPQHNAHVLPDTLKRGNAQQRLAAAGGNFQTDVRHRLTGRCRPGNVVRNFEGSVLFLNGGKNGSIFQRLPRGTRVVFQFIGNFDVFCFKCFCGLFVFEPFVLQCVNPSLQLIERVLLVGFESHFTLFAFLKTSYLCRF